MRAAYPNRKTPESIHASMIPTACTLDEVATHNRVDPYWDQLWVPGSQANWTTAFAERYRRQHGNTPGVPPRLLMNDEQHGQSCTPTGLLRQSSWRRLLGTSVSWTTGQRHWQHLSQQT